MKRFMCLIALAFVLTTSVPSTFAQDGTPITVGGGGGRAVAQAQTSPKPFEKFQNFANSLKIRSVVMLVQMGLI